MRHGLLSLLATFAAIPSGCNGGGGLVDDGSDEVTQTIGPDGGVLESADGNLRISFPPGAVTEDTLFRIARDFNAPPGHIGNAYRVAPQLSLFVPAELTYAYGSTALGRPPEQVIIGANRDGAWVPLDLVERRIDLTELVCTDGSIAFNYGLIDVGGVSTGTDTIDSSTDTDTTDPTEGTDTVSTTDGTTGGTTDPTDSTGSTGGDTDATTTTGADPLCGDGIPVTGEVCYLEGVSFTAPSGPRAVVSADFDGDGHMDTAVAGGGATGSIQVRFGNGAGILASPVSYVVGTNPAALALARMDAGNVDDLIVVNEDDGTVGILLGSSNGTFAAEDTFAVGGTLPIALAIGDFDEDGNLDVVTANEGSEDVSLLLGDGNGALAADDDFSLTAPPRAIGAGDFTGDGNLDFVTSAGTNLTLSAGNGMGGFGGASLNSIGAATRGFAIADFNGDANSDVAVATDDDNVTIALGNGTTGFGGGVPYSTGAGPVAVVAADIDLDGELDLVVVNATDGTVTILIGTGAGAFGSPSTFAVGDGPTAVAIADFNEDGVPDIAVTNGGANDVSVLLSNP
jgi:hypothetical protein